MKKSILFLALAATCLTASAQNITFKSTRSFSGAGFVNAKHTIKIKYGKTDDDCDTLCIDNQRFFVLASGDNGEMTSKGKYNWQHLFFGLNDPNTGRWITPGGMDYDFKCYVTVGADVQSHIAKEIFISNHGLITTYFK